MKKTKGTGAMLFSMIAVIVIICLFIVAGNGAKILAARAVMVKYMNIMERILAF